MYKDFVDGVMVELVDTIVLGTILLGGVGSSPIHPTSKKVLQFLLHKVGDVASGVKRRAEILNDFLPTRLRR